MLPVLFFNSQMNLQYFAGTLVWFLTRFNPTEPYNIHISCISYCVIALTNVIVFIIVLKNWHFNDPNLDSELPEFGRLIWISSNWYFTCWFIPSLNLKTPEYLCTLFTVWVSIFCTVVVYLKGGFWGEGSWAKGTLAQEGLRGFCSCAMNLLNEVIKYNEAFPPMDINIDSCSYCIQKHKNKPNMDIRPSVLIFFCHERGR